MHAPLPAGGSGLKKRSRTLKGRTHAAGTSIPRKGGKEDVPSGVGKKIIEMRGNTPCRSRREKIKGRGEQ